ncbi:unnamed protein product [Ilex paraguariensis]|uniref:C2H2-type domain-containing protein n=1 Tax=Ilex paraguariensis TaxID=185542 RepID=A0ABC8TTE5_9AQUA
MLTQILFQTERKAVVAVEVKEMIELAACKEDKLREPPEKNAAAAAKWTEKKAVAAMEVEEITEYLVKRTSFGSHQRKMQQQLQNGLRRKAAAVVEVQEMTEPAACKEDKLPEPPALKNVQKEWTCAVCQIKPKKEAIKCVSGDTPNKYKTAEQEVKVPVNSSNSEQFKQRNTNTSNAGMKLSKRGCSICDVRCPGEIDMAAHLNGSKHLSRIKKIFDLCGGEQVWECGICNVRFSAESVMVGHLNGKMHLSRVEQMLNPIGGQPAFCSICNHLSRIQEMINPGGGQSGWDYGGGSLGWDYGGGSSGWEAR